MGNECERGKTVTIESKIKTEELVARALAWVLFNLSFTCFHASFAVSFYKTTGSIFIDSPLCMSFAKATKNTEKSRVAARLKKRTQIKEKEGKKLKIIKWEIGIWNRIWLITLARAAPFSFRSFMDFSFDKSSAMEPIDSAIIRLDSKEFQQWSKNNLFN